MRLQIPDPVISNEPIGDGMSLKKKFLKTLKNCYISVCRATRGLKAKSVLFTSFDGRSYSDNPRAISEKLHEMYPDTEITWLLRKKSSIVPSYVKVVDQKSMLRYYRAIVTARVVVTNAAFPDVPKGRGQMFIQTWHGDRAFKKIQYDNPYIPEDYFRAESQDGFCDLCVAGSDYGERKFRSAFRYKGEILKAGTPRDDRLVEPDPGEIMRIKASLGIDRATKILLYAPTIRKEHLDGIELRDIDLERTVRKLEEKYACKWQCFVRAHPGNRYVGGIAGKEDIRDVSDYEDMADLLLISDMLITDYSSTAGDYALLNRPLVLFQSDREEYMRNERTFYFDPLLSPYYIAESQEELETVIAGLSEQSVRENCRAILDFYGCCESGNASEAVAGRIHRWISSGS